MEDLYGDLEDPFFSLEDDSEQENQPPISNAELNSLKEHNTKLSSQNAALKMNISCLYKTAQLELERKESIISRLMKRVKRLEAEKRSLSQPMENEADAGTTTTSNDIVATDTTKNNEEGSTLKTQQQNTMQESQETINAVPPGVDNKTDCQQLPQEQCVKDDATGNQSGGNENRSSDPKVKRDKQQSPISDSHKNSDDKSASKQNGQREKDLRATLSRNRTNGDRHKKRAESERNDHHSRRSHSPLKISLSHTHRRDLKYRAHHDKENMLSRVPSDSSNRREERTRLRDISPHRSRPNMRDIHDLSPRRSRPSVRAIPYRSRSREPILRRERCTDIERYRKRRRSLSRSPHRGYHSYTHRRESSERYRELKRRRYEDRHLETITRVRNGIDTFVADYSPDISCPPTPTADYDDTSESGSIRSSSRSGNAAVFVDPGDEYDDGWMSDDSVGCSKFIFDVDNLTDEEEEGKDMSGDNQRSESVSVDRELSQSLVSEEEGPLGEEDSELEEGEITDSDDDTSDEIKPRSSDRHVRKLRTDRVRLRSFEHKCREHCSSPDQSVKGQHTPGHSNESPLLHRSVSSSDQKSGENRSNSSESQSRSDRDSDSHTEQLLSGADCQELSENDEEMQTECEEHSGQCEETSSSCQQPSSEIELSHNIPQSEDGEADGQAGHEENVVQSDNGEGVRNEDSGVQNGSVVESPLNEDERVPVDQESSQIVVCEEEAPPSTPVDDLDLEDGEVTDSEVPLEEVRDEEDNVDQDDAVTEIHLADESEGLPIDQEPSHTQVNKISEGEEDALPECAANEGSDMEEGEISDSDDDDGDTSETTSRTEPEYSVVSSHETVAVQPDNAPSEDGKGSSHSKRQSSSDSSSRSRISVHNRLGTAGRRDRSKEHRQSLDHLREHRPDSLHGREHRPRSSASDRYARDIRTDRSLRDRHNERPLPHRSLSSTDRRSREHRSTSSERNLRRRRDSPTERLHAERRLEHHRLERRHSSTHGQRMHPSSQPLRRSSLHH